MKKKEEILSDLMATLAELQTGEVKGAMLRTYLKTKLEVLYNVLGEDVPEEYWEQIESLI